MGRLAHTFAFSKALLYGWLTTLTLLALPLFSFHTTNMAWLLTSLVSVALALFGSFAAESRRASARPPIETTDARSSRHFGSHIVVFSVLTLVGSGLILVDQGSSLAGFDIENLQDKYVALTELANAGDTTGTYLSTLGNGLRAFFPLAVTSLVAFSCRSRRVGASVILSTLVGAAFYYSALATASRAYVIFMVVVIVMAAAMVRHPLLRRKGVLLAALVLGVVYLMTTMSQRLEGKLGDYEAVARDYLLTFFDADAQWLGNRVADYLGAPGMTIPLYLSHPLPEFSKLVADGTSQYSLGAHSLFLVLRPLKLIGIDLAPAQIQPDRPGMWWGMLGDLYLDFGVLFIVAYPLAVYAMVRTAKAVQPNSAYGLGFRSVTAAMLFASPFFGVINTFSFTYFGMLALAFTSARRTSQRSNVRVLQHSPLS
jgi:hypothetical protein